MFGVINPMVSLQIKSINASTYDHEYMLEIEWKANFDSCPINIEMEIETPTTKDKTQKRSVDEIGDVEMVDVHTSIKAKTQEVEEEEIETRFMEINPDQPTSR